MTTNALADLKLSTKTLYNDTKDLLHQPFQVLSNPLTMAAVGIGGIAVIYGLTKF